MFHGSIVQLLFIESPESLPGLSAHRGKEGLLPGPGHDGNSSAHSPL